MRQDSILWERDQRVGTITLNRPEKLNALSRDLLLELDEVLEEARNDDAVGVLIIRGAGRAFSAGFDLNPSSPGRANRGDVVDDRDNLRATLDRWLRVYDFPKPIIAQVHGYCLAGATQLAIMADITIVATDARIGLPSIPVGAGFIPPFWTWLVGPKRAKELAYVPGSQISGQTAADWGFANRAVPPEQLESEVRALAESIARVPAKVLKLQKTSINRTMEVQGFRTAISLGADIDAMAHFSEPVQHFQRLIASHGLKGALDHYNAGDLGG